MKGLKGEVKEDVIISGEVTAPPPRTPPDFYLITAQVEGSTLTHTQYNTVVSLMSSLLCLPTHALAYVGHTLNPLTLHWHCTTTEGGKSNPVYSVGLLSEMVEEGIRMINVGTAQDIVIPQRNVSILVPVYTCLSVWGELVNHKRSLTHRPSSQGWTPRHPTHFVIACFYTYLLVLDLGFLSL